MILVFTAKLVVFGSESIFYIPRLLCRRVRRLGEARYVKPHASVATTHGVFPEPQFMRFGDALPQRLTQRCSRLSKPHAASFTGGSALRALTMGKCQTERSPENESGIDRIHRSIPDVIG